ncbi:MAG: PAS domain S-box protein, partial [Proteobacteria bacterium]|nr:PAS domain S-box protein [Pseudomonadota bacterium]
MTDSSRTNQELAEENALLKQKIHALEKSRAGCKQINEALRESENWLQTIIEGTHALLLSVDINGYFTYVNDATARAVAYTNSEELIGKSYLHFVHLEDRQKVLDTFINQVNTLQQSSMQEFRITDTNGKVKWISLLSSLTIKEGQVVGQIGVAQDISERKQAEQINRMLFAIANAVNSNEDLNELYKRIRLILGNIIDVTNFFIAIIDRSKRTVSFPYHVDTVDEDFSPFNGDDTESTLTGLIVAEKKAFLLRKDELLERNSRNGIRGPLPLIWMGSPLLIREEVIGVVAVQSYTDADVYDEADLRLLTAVSQQIAVAIDRKRFLDNLQESEERLNFLVKNSSDILVIINADGSQRYSSPAAERITGFAMAELESRTIDTLVHPDDMDVVKKAWDEAVKHPEKTVTVQFRHVHKTRGWIYSEAVAQSFLAEPATNGVIANVRDITEHKRVERFLKEVITKNPMSIQILDKEGLTLEVNHSYKSLFGSVPPSGYSIFSDPQLLQMGMGKIFDQLRNGASVRFPDTYFNAHDSLSEFPDVPAWIRTLGFPLNDNNEKPERFVLMHENITERKQAEEALRESEETFRNIVQASPMGIHLYQLQNDGRLVFVGTNPAADKLLGVDNTRFIGMTIEEAFPPLQHTEIPSRYRRAAQLGESWHTEQIDYDHDKIVGAFEVYAFQMSLGKVAVLFNDITERKLAEEERERLQMQLTQAQKMEAI